MSESCNHGKPQAWKGFSDCHWFDCLPGLVNPSDNTRTVTPVETSLAKEQLSMQAMTCVTSCFLKCSLKACIKPASSDWRQDVVFGGRNLTVI